MKAFFTTYWYDFLGLFYPNLCYACQCSLPPGQEIVCTRCQYELPRTQFHLQSDNPFVRHFWGRLDVTAATALFHFVKGGKTQQLIHQLKYKGKKEVGVYLGKLLGRQLQHCSPFAEADWVLPVPLHPRKQRKRGYNQSDYFAQGLAESMEVSWAPDLLRRVVATHSQTKKGRMHRFANVSEAFTVAQPEKLRNKHVLLVDDVITTGATLEACAHKILEIPKTKVSFATIAFANL